jgi:hypothetical protein
MEEALSPCARRRKSTGGCVWRELEQSWSADASRRRGAGIATMAVFRDPNPYTPFYRRVHTFITQHLYGLEA